MDISHCRNELRHEISVAGGQDLVADGDQSDVASRVVRKHIRVDPLCGGGEIGGEAGNVAVGGADDDTDAGVSEGSENHRIGAVEADFSDGGGLEELDGGLRRREVVGDLAVVYADEGLRF